MAVALAAVSAMSTAAVACTGITLSTTGNDFVQARTVELGEDNIHSKLVIVPRDFTYTSTLPNQKPGMSWKSKYGFVGISVAVDNFIGDGVNEHGLTAGLFYFPDYGSLAPFNPKRVKNTMVDMDFVRWVLSQHKTVDEVKKGLKKITLAPVAIIDGKPTPTAHWRIADKEGNVIIIEIINNGEVKIYDNTARVVTNSPDYPWHVTNLNNYVNLGPGTADPKKMNGVNLKSFGVGTAFYGLPGDISPPSRFVRAAFYVNSAPELKTTEQAVSEAFHILNNFDIPIGAEYAEKHREHMPNLPSATQWTTAIDQSNQAFYYKTMNDSTIQKVDLKKVDFSGKEQKVQELDKGRVFHYQDVTIK